MFVSTLIEVNPDTNYTGDNAVQNGNTYSSVATYVFRVTLRKSHQITETLHKKIFFLNLQI